MNLFIMQFSAVSCYFCLGSNVLLGTMLSNTLGLRFPKTLKLHTQPPHPKIVLCILYLFLNSQWIEEKF